MKYFKIKALCTAPRYEITPQNFNRYTENKPPFEQVGSDGIVRQYGICPSCLNPVQLVGIYKKIKRNPYGIHAGKNIEGLPEWNYYKYQFCPFAKSKDRKIINPDERGIITKETVELYNLLKTQFDRVVLLISKEFGFSGQGWFWKKAIQQFRKSEGYCYPWLTESNLPYIFAFFGLQQQRLYKQKIAVGSDLYKAVCKYPKVKFDYTSSRDYPTLINSENQFVNLCFRFTDHSQKTKDGEELTESIKFCVDDMDNNKTIFEKRVIFKEMYFLNLINKGENENRRTRWLLDLAAENLPPIRENT